MPIRSPGYMLGLEKERAPANIAKLPQVVRPLIPEVARKALDEARQALNQQSASDREH